MERIRLRPEDVFQDQPHHPSVPKISEPKLSPEYTLPDKGLKYFNTAVDYAVAGEDGSVFYIPDVVAEMDAVGVDPTESLLKLDQLRNQRLTADQRANLPLALNGALAATGQFDKVKKWDTRTYRFAIDYALRHAQDPTNLIEAEQKHLLNQAQYQRRKYRYIHLPSAAFKDLAIQSFKAGNDYQHVLGSLEDLMNKQANQTGHGDTEAECDLLLAFTLCGDVPTGITNIQHMGSKYKSGLMDHKNELINDVVYPLIESNRPDDAIKILDQLHDDKYARAIAKARQARIRSEQDRIIPVSAAREIKNLLGDDIDSLAFSKIYPDLGVAYAQSGDREHASTYLSGAWDAAFDQEFGSDKYEVLLGVANAVQDIGTDATDLYRFAFSSWEEWTEGEKELAEYFGIPTQIQHEVLLNATKRGNISVGEELADQCIYIGDWQSIQLLTELGKQHTLASRIAT